MEGRCEKFQWMGGAFNKLSTTLLSNKGGSNSNASDHNNPTHHHINEFRKVKASGKQM